jgi:hypothetical protein
MDARGFHHAYLGAALMLGGFLAVVFTGWPLWVCLEIVFVGVVIFADDLYQHARQRKDPAYRSPLNRLYAVTLWRIPLIQKLNRLVDRILGRKA